jgi:hypothetical protein
MVLAMKKFSEIQEYSQLIEECTTRYQLANKKKVIKDTLNRLEQEAGTLDLDRITEYICIKNGGHISTDILSQHIKGIIVDLIKKEGEVMSSLEKTEDTFVSKVVVQGLIEIMASLTVEEVLHKLVQKKRKEEENEDIKGSL